MLSIFYKPTCLQKNAHGRVLSIRVISSEGHYELITNIIASRDQFKPIEIGENLVVNYKTGECRVNANSILNNLHKLH